MTDSGTVDVHVGPYDYTNDIRVNLWLSWNVPFALRYFTKPSVHWYPPESSPCSLYRCSRYRFCSSFSLKCSCIPVTLSPVSGQKMMDAVTMRGPKNISPSSEEQIPLSSYPVTCQTFRWAWKLSLWSLCYRWRLSNPKVHRPVGCDWHTLMVWGTKTHANTPYYNKWFQTI
jgi:hypothetical protein